MNSDLSNDITAQRDLAEKWVGELSSLLEMLLEEGLDHSNAKIIEKHLRQLEEDYEWRADAARKRGESHDS